MIAMIQGKKKPLNMLEAPVYPDIRMGPPQVRSAGKHWKVDVGRTQLELGDMPHVLGDAILAVSKDYPTTSVGQYSHKDVVNKNFRPPLIDQWSILRPLNRQPIESVVPRINPDATRWASRNERPSDVSHVLTDLIKTGQLDVGIKMPFGSGVADIPLPDLETIMPKTNVGQNSRTRMFTSIGEMPMPINVRSAIQDDVIEISATAGYTPIVTSRIEDAREHIELGYKNPQVSATARVEAFTMIDMPTSGGRQITDVELDDVNPRYSATSGYTPATLIDGYNAAQNMTLEEKRASISATSGFKSALTKEVGHRLDELEFEKRIEAPMEVGYRVPTFDNPERYRPDGGHLAQSIIENPMQLSAIAGTESRWKEPSERSAKMSFHSKLQPMKREVSAAGAMPGHGLMGVKSGVMKAPRKVTSGDMRRGMSAGTMIPAVTRPSSVPSASLSGVRLPY